MAFVPKQIPEDEQNQFGRTEQTTPFPTPASGGSTGDSGTSGGAAPGVGTPTQFGSNAAKLSDYLKANEPQVKQYGQDVAGKLSQGYTDTMSSINQGVSDFGQQVSQGYKTPDQARISQAASNPGEFVKDQNNVNDFQSWYNQSYGGPNDFESSPIYSNVNNQVNQAVQNAGLVKDFGGLKTYLNNNMGGGNKTQGMQTLDTALLQRSPESRAAIQAAASPYQNLTGYLTNKTGESNQAVQQAKQNVNDSKQVLQNQFTGENGIIPQFHKELQDRFNNETQQNQVDFDEIKNSLSRGGLSQQRVAQLGLDPTQFQSFIDTYENLPEGLNFDPSSYFKNNLSSVTLDNFATSADYERAKALSELTGADTSFLNQQNIGNAGTAAQNPFGFDVNMASSDLSGLLANYKPDAPSLTGTSTPTDTKLTQAVGGDASKVINKAIGDPESGMGIVSPLTNPIGTTKKGVEAIEDTTKSLFGNEGGWAKDGGVDALGLASTVAGNFNKYLPAQYQINPSSINESKNIMSVIPPQGVVSDVLRNAIIQNVFAGLPSGAMSNADSSMQKQIANAIRENKANATQDQIKFLTQYEKEHPQESKTYQDILDSIDQAKKNPGAIGFGGIGGAV